DLGKDEVLFGRVALQHAEDLDVEALDAFASPEIREPVTLHAGDQLLDRKNLGWTVRRQSRRTRRRRRSGSGERGDERDRQSAEQSRANRELHNAQNVTSSGLHSLASATIRRRPSLTVRNAYVTFDPDDLRRVSGRLGRKY